MQWAMARVDECVFAVARGATVALMVVHNRAKTAGGDGGGGAGGWVDHWFGLHASSSHRDS
jgi:hypothetical protein